LDGLISTFLEQVGYHRLKKKQKGLVRKLLLRATGYSQVQLKRLISKHRKGKLHWKPWQHGGGRLYNDCDIALLHEADTAHQCSGVAIRHVLNREYHVYGKTEYRKIANISVAHIYNLRQSSKYLCLGRVLSKTKSTPVNIGKRQKPKPNGKPGYFRVDTVHQGDIVIQGKTWKSVYFINLVDEVTQWEYVFCVSAICQEQIEEVLKQLVALCPFIIKGFHSDNGSEFINRIVAAFLSLKRISQTKNRSRKSNDNALCEGKNGSVIRKHFGHFYIPAKDNNVELLNTFCRDWLCCYLNFHHPCGFATTIVDQKGKQKKIYRYGDYRTPYEKLKSLPNSEQYLKPGMSFAKLDRIATSESDTEFALNMQSAKQETLEKLNLEIPKVVESQKNALDRKI